MAAEQQLDPVEKHIEALPKEGITCLPSSMEVDFPRGTPAQQGAVRSIRALMTVAFGGVTTLDGTGCWKDDAGKRICDPVTVLRSRHNCGDAEQIKKVYNAIEAEGRAQGQETVAIAGTNRFYTIPPGRLRGARQIPKE